MYKSKTSIENPVGNQHSNCWIIKGNKNNPDRDGNIVKQMRDYIDGIDRSPNWWSQLGKPIPEDFRAGHIVLAWRARRKIGIVGIGQLRKKEEHDSSTTEYLFEWEPIDCFPPNQDFIEPYISLKEIRSALAALPERAREPTFTKPCVIQTVYPVSVRQAEVLKSLIERKVKSLSPKAKQLLGKISAPSRARSVHAERHA